MHTGHDDDVRFDIRALTGQCERVTDEIRYAMENLRRLVIMRQNDGIPFFLQRVDRCDLRRKNRPFDLRDNPFDLCV